MSSGDNIVSGRDNGFESKTRLVGQRPDFSPMPDFAGVAILEVVPIPGARTIAHPCDGIWGQGSVRGGRGVVGLGGAEGTGVLGHGGCDAPIADYEAAGVDAHSAGGIGVQGTGGDGAFGINPGTGVHGHGGRPGALTSGVGVVGVAGGADDPAFDDIASTGVFGKGAPAVIGNSLPGRGGVFESPNIAQVRLVPVRDPIPPLPAIGQFGDLYVKLVVTFAAPPTVKMFLCVQPGDGASAKAQWAPFVLGPAEAGG